MNNPLMYTDPTGYEYDYETPVIIFMGISFYTLEEYEFFWHNDLQSITAVSSFNMMVYETEYPEFSFNDFETGPSFSSMSDMVSYMNANGYNHWDSENGFMTLKEETLFKNACDYNDRFNSWMLTEAESRRAAEYNYAHGYAALKLTPMTSIDAAQVSAASEIKGSLAGVSLANNSISAFSGGVSNISQQGIDFIASWEKYRQYPYDDGYGYMTVGYGHKIRPGENYSNGHTPSEAKELLKNDIQTIAVGPINKYVNVPLSQQQFDALASYVYNVGPGNSLINTKLIQYLNQRNYSQAVKEMNIITSGGSVAPGLITRRADEQNIWNYGIYNLHK